MTEEPFVGIRKLSYYMPAAQGTCGGCGQPIVYNLAIQLLEHVEPNSDCPRPWVKVERTPEEQERIRAAETEAIAEDKAARERHAWMLANAPHPILRELVAAHRPASEDLYPACAECPAPPSEIDGDPEPTAWPCGVWMFISDRWEAS